MRRLQLITCAFWLAILGHALARGQEPTADLLPALLAVDVEPQSNGGAQAPVPAPVAGHDGQPAQAITTAPPAAGPFTINWVTPAAAAASPLPDWWHATPADIRTCIPCMKAEALFADKRVVEMSRRFDCVRVRTFGSETPLYPSDLFTPHGYVPRRDPYKRFVAGAPSTAYGYVQRFREALKAIGGAP
jgi:hypothetical protein